MLILSKDDVEFMKAQGAKQGTMLARYRQKLYRHIGNFNDLQQAIMECRQRLDSGEFCLIISDGASRQSLWQAVKMS